MSNIIGFPVQRRILKDHVASAESSAEILFFTGVRYERQIEPEPKAGLPAGLKRNRMSRPNVRTSRRRKQQA
jgi:hypothetical protein